MLVDGITILNPQHYTVYGGQSENLTIRNLKSFSARPWSDGIDLMSCRHVKIDHVFYGIQTIALRFIITVGGIGAALRMWIFPELLYGVTGHIP